MPSAAKAPSAILSVSGISQLFRMRGGCESRRIDRMVQETGDREEGVRVAAKRAVSAIDPEEALDLREQTVDLGLGLLGGPGIHQDAPLDAVEEQKDVTERRRPVFPSRR